MSKAIGQAVLCAATAAASMMLGSAWAHEPGRMTGGGSFFCPYLTGNQRVTHGFELHCKLDGVDVSEPNNLEINFSGGDNFHLTTLTAALCTDTQAIEQPPSAGFDTFEGAGTGTFNGQAAAITFTFTDGGEPGTKDTAVIKITVGGSTVIDCPSSPSSFLTFGNHQAHRATGNKP
ncbi:hypothetical protein J7E62_27200 [Variovorax paradoxus]|nr:hypothetical protein [Variovorax paradoxus]